MGWDFGTAKYTDVKKGRVVVDRKAEIMDVINTRDYYILKMVGVGNTYYAAMQNKETKEVFCGVILTKVRSNGWWGKEFGYKMMDEFWGPVEAKCPKSILNLLTPTENAIANEWRQKCWDYATKPKLGDLPVGTIIELDWDGNRKRFIKQKHRKGTKWFSLEPGQYNCYCPSASLNEIGWNVIQRGE